MIGPVRLSIVDLLYRYLQMIETTEGDDNAIRRIVSESPRTDDLQILPTQTGTQSGADKVACNLLFFMRIFCDNYEK
jgi:hypothetical protein